MIVLFSQQSFHILFYLFFDHSRVHVGDLSNGELGSNLSRDYSLSAGVGEGPLDAMDGDSGVAPQVSQQVHLQKTPQIESQLSLTFHYTDSIHSSHLVAVHELGHTDLALVVLHVKLDVLVHLPFLIRERRHSFSDPRNQDLTVGADQSV